jgi:phosphatidylserine/phosphatidylglycerophosphate/cardiolipin synthase-like enzyme
MTRRKKTSSSKSKSKKTTKRSLPLYIAIPLIACLAILYLLQTQGILDLGLFELETTPTAPITTPGGPSGGQWYTALYFTVPQYPDKPEDHHGGIDEQLVAGIQKAQQTIDIAAYDFDLENVAEALVAAQERGVQVRFVTDSDNVDEAGIKILKKAKIKVVEDDRGAIMHDKFIVIDGYQVWTGSWNLTANGTYRNNNNVIVINSPRLAENYEAEFDEMFADKEFGPNSPADTPHPVLTINGVQVENYFAPEDDVSEKVAARLEEAQKSIYFMAFSFTDDRMGRVIADKAKAGLAVGGVFEARGSDTEYSEYGRMRRRGLDVLVDGNPYILHHKVLIIDEKVVVLGSYNFTQNADESNDENVLIVHDSGLAARYLEEYHRARALAESAQ